MDFEGRIEVARDAMRHAASMALDIKASFLKEEKPDGSLVTTADLEIESYLRSRMREAFPDDGFVGEEFPDLLGSSGYYWEADPIDYTRGYASGKDTYVINLTLYDKDLPVLGLITNPERNQEFLGKKGGEVTVNGKCVRAGSTGAPMELIVSSAPERIAIHELQRQGVLPPDQTEDGSFSYCLAKVASGYRDIFIGMAGRGYHSYDISAGELMVNLVGGRVSGIDGNGLDGTWLVAARTLELHRKTIEALKYLSRK